MKTKFLIIFGIFLVIFSVDGFLLLDSSIPECKGFTAMGWFVFFSLGFEPMAILSNPECLELFAGQIVSVTLFAMGLGIIIRKMMNIRNVSQKLKNPSLKK